MRRLLIALSICIAFVATADVSFVTPVGGMQAIGPMALEVSFDTAHVDRVDFYVDEVLAGVARTPPYRIAYDFGTSLAAHKITAKVWSNGFRTSEFASVTTAAPTVNDTLDVDVVEVPLRIHSSHAVKPSDLRVSENGVTQTVREVTRERPPAHFAFIVDRSLSMGNGKLDAALRAVHASLGQLHTGDTSSLVLFNHHVEQARDARDATNVKPSGGTSLRDALASVASKQRTYAIVITDGGDRNSALSEEEALRRISGTKTIVYAIALGETHTRFLDRAATNTGGRVVEASKESLSRDLRAIFEDINSRYLLVYQSSGTKRGWRTIDVQSRYEILAARKGYFAE